MVIEASVATVGMDCGVVGRASVLMQRMLALRPGCRHHADAVIGERPKHRRKK